MKKIIIISGPTGVGKTNISIQLAKLLDGEIISADSMQVYRGLNVGSAKITIDEMQGIKHHLIDILDPDENFDVSIFQKLASEAIDDICSRGKTPIIVGGTAFYIQALLYGINFNEEIKDLSYRDSLQSLSEDELYDMLSEVDNEYALATHKNNKKRVIRALEYYHNTGKKFSDYNLDQSQKEAVYLYKYFVLNDERDKLYERINKRVDIMLEDGLLEEVKYLSSLNLPMNCNSRQGIGYKEMFSYLNGECSLVDAVEAIKQNSRRFAKRQLTWLRHEDDTIFINKNEFDYNDNKMVDFMIEEFSRLSGE